MEEESTLRGYLWVRGLLGGWLVGSRRSTRGLLGIEATRVGELVSVNARLKHSRAPRVRGNLRSDLSFLFGPGRRSLNAQHIGGVGSQGKVQVRNNVKMGQANAADYFTG